MKLKLFFILIIASIFLALSAYSVFSTVSPLCNNDGNCDFGEDSGCSDCVTGPYCGDGNCDFGEDNSNCPSDCAAPGPYCGDGNCDFGENAWNCQADCGAPPPTCDVEEYNECTGCLTSHRVRRNADCSYSVVVESQYDAACTSGCPPPQQCEVRQYNECTGCQTSRRVQQNADCSYSVIVESQYDAACTSGCPAQCEVREYNECTGCETSRRVRQNADCSYSIVVDSQYDAACTSGCPSQCQVREYNECTGCQTSRRVRQNADCSYDVVIPSQSDSACSGSTWCPSQCEVREYNECTGCQTSRRVRQNEDCSYSVIIPSQADPACTSGCPPTPSDVTVSGRAFCENSGSAVNGATIKLYNDRLNIVKTATTDANGRWSITDNFNSAIGGDHNYAFRSQSVGTKTPKNTYEQLKVNSNVVQMTVFPFLLFSHNSLDFRYDCPAEPPANQKPEGFLDAADCSAFSGWARDPDTTAPISVHLYANAPAGAGGVFLGSATANLFRSDLCNRWGNGNADCSHGFSFSTPASLKDGVQHLIYAYGIDSSGGENTLLSNSPRTIFCERPNNAPILNPIGDKSVQEGQLLQFSISGSDPDNDPLTFSASNLPSGAIFNPSTRTFSWTPNFEQAGSYQVTFSVSDGRLSDSETITIIVFEVNQPPTLTEGSVNPSRGSINDVYFYRIKYADSDNDAPVFVGLFIDGFLFSDIVQIDPSDTNYADGAIFEINVPGDFIGRGSHTFFFDAFDGFFYILSDEYPGPVIENSPPILDPIGNKQVNEGDLLEFMITGSDPDADLLTFSAVNLPSGASFNPSTRIFSWTPGFTQSGSYQVAFSVSDGELSNSEAITITVGNVNAAPRFVTTPPTEVVEPDLSSFSAVYRYEAHAVDPDNDVVAYSMPVSPQGAVIDPSTGLILWTPSKNQLGSNNFFTIIASDGQLSDTQSWTVTVKLPDRINLPREELFLEHVNVPECLAPGESDAVFVSMENIGLHPLNDFTVTAVAFDDDLRRRIGPFDIDVGERMETSFLMTVPDYMAEGRYELRVTFSNDFVRRVKHREFEVSSNCRKYCSICKK